MGKTIIMVRIILVIKHRFKNFLTINFLKGISNLNNYCYHLKRFYDYLGPSTCMCTSGIADRRLSMVAISGGYLSYLNSQLHFSLFIDIFINPSMERTASKAVWSNQIEYYINVTCFQYYANNIKGSRKF